MTYPTTAIAGWLDFDALDPGGKLRQEVADVVADLNAVAGQFTTVAKQAGDLYVRLEHVTRQAGEAIPLRIGEEWIGRKNVADSLTEIASLALGLTELHQTLNAISELVDPDAIVADAKAVTE